MEENVQQNIDINFSTNAEAVATKTEKLVTVTEKLSDNTDKASGASKKMTASLSENTDTVAKNGGAMAILNAITGGYAQMVKDAWEALELFSFKKKADTVATTTNTVATVSANTATQQGILTKIKDIATTGLATATKYASVVATGVATAAQWLWNAAVVANPLVAFVVAIIATIAAIYKLTTFLIDSNKANEDAAKATAKATKELAEQQKQAEKTAQALKNSNEQTLKLAEASGASAEELRKLRLKHAEEESALQKKNTELAKSTLLRQLDTLEMLKNSGASDEVIENQKKLTQSLHDEFKKQNENLKESYKNVKDVRNANQVEVVKEQTDAKNKEIEAQKEHAKKLAEERKKANEDAKAKREAFFKSIKDMETNYLKSIEDLRDKTEEQKLERQKTRDLEAIEQMRSQGANVEELLRLNSEKYAILEDELIEKRREEKRIKDQEYWTKEAEDAAKRGEEQKIIDDAILQQKQEIEDQKLNIASRGIQLISQIFGKSKAIQKAAIIAENAVGIGKMVIDNNRANIGALSTPQAIASSGATAAPVIALNNITTGIGIASSIAATAKALSALGGGSAPSGGKAGGMPGGGNAPQVGFQNSNENQISNSINASRAETPPIQAFVVSQEVTNSQQIDRNRILSNSF